MRTFLFSRLGAVLCDIVGIIACFFSARVLEMAVFGQVDNLFLSVGTVLGGLYGSKVSDGKSSGTIVGCLLGGMLGNAFSDGLGGICEPSMTMTQAIGVTIGCLCIVLFIPRISRIMNWVDTRNGDDDDGPDGAVSKDEHYHTPNAKHMHGEYKLSSGNKVRIGRWCVCEVCGHEVCLRWPDASKHARDMYKPGYECTMCAQLTRKLDEEARIEQASWSDDDEDIDVYVGDGIGNDNGL